jgi:hypothetical protein
MIGKANAGTAPGAKAALKDWLRNLTVFYPFQLS